MRARFAPSPTGDLHVGGAWTALAAWALARSAHGATVLRVEDIDPPRVVAGSAARIEEDLAWLGLDWDEGPREGGKHAPYTQSARAAIYETALEKLAGLTYPCDCSRAEIARVASAPHPGEEMVYPGTCRDADPSREMKRPPAIRLRVPAGTTIAFDETVGKAPAARVEAAGAFEAAAAARADEQGVGGAVGRRRAGLDRARRVLRAPLSLGPRHRRAPCLSTPRLGASQPLGHFACAHPPLLDQAQTLCERADDFLPRHSALS